MTHDDTLTPRTDAIHQKYITAAFARQLERELTAMTEQRDRLAEALSLAGKLCHVVHHPKSMQHETFDPCPVEALIKQALSKPNQPTEP